MDKIVFLKIFFLLEKGKIKRIAIDITNAITPPNLLGIDRKIAYANKKYHSGWIWIGVTNGLAGIKLSGSPNILGFIKVNIVNIEIIKINPNKSLNEK